MLKLIKGCEHCLVEWGPPKAQKLLAADVHLIPKGRGSWLWACEGASDLARPSQQGIGLAHEILESTTFHWESEMEEKPRNSSGQII